ncbi:FemAB family protein [Novipirellula aureliae]|uniref:FemAB family protein n=1 Tax=Novipirellula aureliae TaxID=2527966 RepID=A0A5C6EA38_9BACT|nr:FemAB family XrtA/PEP-CTERM system-associated protein [Novipirellula aureliae]TWU44356.1 FemAB family protein [Novipirellula aureliae]
MNTQTSATLIETIKWSSSPTRPRLDVVDDDSVVPRLNAHRDAWVASVAAGLGHQAYLIRACNGQETTGVLPLILVSGPLFGRFLVSLPYLNTGGVWARDQETAIGLINHACVLADQLDVKHLELRHEIPVDHPRLNFSRTDKVHMRLQLPDTADDLMKSFKSKVRSQVKKSTTAKLSVHFGGAECLDDFYQVFARNMRDLGTPVFSRALFDASLKYFHGKDGHDFAELCIVRNETQPVAAAILVHAGGVTEVPSASSLREFNHTNANMLMYWRLLERAIANGSHTFDFGRSSRDSGTYKFKAQWGAHPHDAVWQYYVRKGDPNAMRADDAGNQRLVRIWQHLPVWLTKLVGPTIVRGIP